jgi:hypothetical protein
MRRIEIACPLDDDVVAFNDVVAFRDAHSQKDMTLSTTDVLVTFEDLPLWPNDFAGDPLPTEYDGFVWTNWGQVYDAQLLRDGTPVPSGYLAADASGPKAVYGGFPGDTMIGSGDGSDFDFQSGYFTSAWKDGATLTVTGYDNGAQVAVQSFAIGTSASTYVEFTSDFDSVDQLVFHSEGGIENGYGIGNGFIVDDLSFSYTVDNAPPTHHFQWRGHHGSDIACRERHSGHHGDGE